MPTSHELTEEERGQLRLLAATHTVEGAARIFDLAPSTFARLAGGLRVHRSTVAAARNRIRELRAEAALPVTEEDNFADQG